MSTDKEMQNLLYNIKRLRLDNKLSKKKMAQICGVGVPKINKIENGIVPPRFSANILVRIYRHFGVTPTEMFRDSLLSEKQDKCLF